MIIKENRIKVENVNEEFMLISDEEVNVDEIIFFDLEHYVYKKPKCIGVFGAAIYEKESSEILVTQYMLENKREVKDILHLALNYFREMKMNGKKAISTFSGNNDFTVINYLFNKFNIAYDFNEEFYSIDLQVYYEKEMKTCIGLKNLEKVFEIEREGDLISGSNLAKTFGKVLKDSEYIKRMPQEKIEKILLYNEQDVVNLYHIFLNWNKYVIKEEEIEEELEEEKIEEITKDENVE